MGQKKKLYVVSMKHYGPDDAKEFIKEDEDYDYDEVILDNRKGE